MRAHQAVEMIERATFKPGWRISASYDSPSQILLSLDIGTVDTSYLDEDGGYPQPKLLQSAKVIDVGTMTSEEELAYEILSFAAELDSHENREFLRFRQPDGSWKAPLHPHVLEGQLCWKILEKTGSHRYL